VTARAFLQTIMSTKTKSSVQDHARPAIHNWHNLIWGYGDNLVESVLSEFDPNPRSVFLDPFCGYGTTLVECQKRGLLSVGVDANPAACFSSLVKTRWGITSTKLLDAGEELLRAYETRKLRSVSLKKDPLFRYVSQSGMMDRGWIDGVRLLRIVLLKQLIAKLPASQSTKDLLSLLLMQVLVRTASNVRFGPELYCDPKKEKARIVDAFRKLLKQASIDLADANPIKHQARVFRGDSRSIDQVVKKHLGKRTFRYVITSPPYPAEHDYTRNTRLELAFLGKVIDRDSLRRLKRSMLRSHTKGIYAGDSDRDLVSRDPMINGLCRRIDRIARTKSHGFARLYSTVLREYCGGMLRHFISLKNVIKKGGRCAYVVGDQASYFGIRVPTAKLLARLAYRAGYRHIRIRLWRRRWATASSKMLREEILFFENPKKAKRRTHAQNQGRRKGIGTPEPRIVPQPSQRAA
jgi:hypothetical protein